MTVATRSPVQARGSARRQALLDATVTLLARHGARAVTHRAVAELAGASHGSTRYYFATREALLDEALRQIANRQVASVEELLLAPGPADPWERAARLSDFISANLVADRDATFARYELFLEAARRPSLRRALREWGDAYTKLFATHLTSESADPEAEAGALLNLLNGLLLQQLAVPREDFEEAVLRPAIERFVPQS